MNQNITITETDQTRGLVARGQKFLDMAARLGVTDDDSYHRADVLNTEGARSIKLVENFINPHIQRANEVHKALTADRAKMIEPIKEGRKIIGGKMADYHSEIERKRKADEARLADAARKVEEAARKVEEDRRLSEAQALEAQGRSEEADQVLSAPEQVPVRLVAPVSNITAPKTNTSFREKWEIEVLDKALVPDEYKIVDQGALNKVAQATKGKIGIPGCRMVCRKISVGRS